ncbi:MAG: endolytic transglycosylase MltG [Candidatus Komeilibacteria bacterium]
MVGPIIKAFFLCLIAAVLIVAAWVTIELFRPTQLPGREIIFNVESGQGVNTISDNLHRNGLIGSKFIFESYVWLIGAEDKLIAARYSLNTGMSIHVLVKELMRGASGQKDNLTFIEGWNRKENAAYLATRGFAAKDYVDLTLSNVAYRDDFPLTQAIPDGNSLEGFLFPDTYQITQSTKMASIVQKQLQNFEAKISGPMISDIRQSGHTLYEVIIMASIIEKEVPLHADKKMIADIFWKRIKAGIGLQSDATVNYITGKGTTRPSLADLKIDSPYNTYKYKGLPPGPISNPGLASIQAALYPTANPYYYFLTDKDGGVHYARTLEEHKKNRELYLN